MSTFPPAGIGAGEFISSISLLNEVVCWAGPSWTGANLLLATESGHIVKTDLAGTEKSKMAQLDLEDESINGIALFERYLAVSTRSIVQLITLAENESEEPVSASLPFGAHGISAGKAGRFFAPVGTRGVMTILPVEGTKQSATMIKPSSEETYFYKLTTMVSEEGKDVVACAARFGGIISYEYVEGSSKQEVGILEMRGLDVIDICSVANPGGAPMAVAVSRDGMMILLRDVLHDDRPLTVRFDSIVGTVYRILVCQDYIFLMTSKAVFIVAGLIEYVRTGGSQKPNTRVMKIPVKGIDMNIVGDRWLLMILTDQVLKLDVEMLKHAPTAMMISWAVDATNTEIRESPWKSRRRESAAMLAG